MSPQARGLDMRVHISQPSPWTGHRAPSEAKLEPDGLCHCLAVSVSPLGECRSCHRLVRPGATARLGRYGRGVLNP